MIIYGSIFIFAFLIWSAAESRKNASNRVVDWLPEGSEELKKFYDYYRLFPEGELLMVSWKGCERTDTRLDEVAVRLSSPDVGQDKPYFSRVITTRSISQELTDDPLNLKPAAARKRLIGWLIGQNEQDACLVAMISPTGEAQRNLAIEHVIKTVEDVVKLSRSDIYIAGPTIDSVAIDTISAKSQGTLLPFFLLFCLLMLLVCIRNLFAAFMIFAIALMNEELGGTLLYWTGGHVDSISMLISTLIYVLSISAGVHLVNYYRETLRETNVVNAPRETIKKAILPCSLAVITTVLGLGSLTVSKMIPIRTFGIFSSASLLIGTAWLFIFICSTLQQYPIRRWSNTDDERKNNRRDRYWKRLGIFVGRYRILISCSAFVLIILSCLGLRHLKTTVTFHGMFPEKAKVIQDYERLENTFGGLIPIEVVVRVPNEDAEKSMILQLYLVKEVCDELKQVEGIDAVVSAMNFTPDLPSRTSRNVGDPGRRAVINSLLRNTQEQLKSTGFFIKTAYKSPEEPDFGNYDPYSEVKYEEFPAMYWRVSLRVSSQYPNDYNVLLDLISQRLDVIKESEIAGEFEDLRFYVTGGVPLVHRAQEQLLSDLIDSFVSAFGLITLSMILLLRSVVRGLLAMIPNLFPCVIVFGSLGTLDIPIDMGTMMTASVAIGIAVDGTLHYLTWFNIGIKRGLKRHNAVFFAYRACAMALFQTTIICGFGMLVFGLSDFIPISRFAILICLLLIVSFIGDIIVLPALLLSPLGKVFELKPKRTTGKFARNAKGSKVLKNGKIQKPQKNKKKNAVKKKKKKT